MSLGLQADDALVRQSVIIRRGADGVQPRLPVLLERHYESKRTSPTVLQVAMLQYVGEMKTVTSTSASEIWGNAVSRVVWDGTAGAMAWNCPGERLMTCILIVGKYSH